MQHKVLQGFDLNTEYGHLAGIIMRKSKVSGRRGTICDSYNVAWEFSALGESSLPSVAHVNASIGGSRVQQIWLFRSSTLPIKKSVAVARQNGRPKGSKK